MAIARLSVKVGGRGKAGPRSDYVFGAGRYASRLKEVGRIIGREFGNMPSWATSPRLFWLASDRHERKNGTTYRAMEIALPRELADTEMIELVREWVHQEIGDRHAYQWSIHCPRASDGGEQPHLHLMFSERRTDCFGRGADLYFRRFNAKSPELGGARKGYGPHEGKTSTSLERAAELKALRLRWGVMCNVHLEAAGSSERIDMRSHAVRRTGIRPQRKMLPGQNRAVTAPL